MLVVPVAGTTLWDRSLKNISQTAIEDLLLANGHEIIRRPRVHVLLCDAITARHSPGSISRLRTIVVMRLEFRRQLSATYGIWK